MQNALRNPKIDYCCNSCGEHGEPATDFFGNFQGYLCTTPGCENEDLEIEATDNDELAL